MSSIWGLARIAQTQLSQVHAFAKDGQREKAVEQVDELEDTIQDIREQLTGEGDG